MGAYGGYSLGTAGIGAFGSPATQRAFVGSQPGFLKSGLFPQVQATVQNMPARSMIDPRSGAKLSQGTVGDPGSKSIIDMLFRRQKEGAAAGVMEIDPLKLALTTTGATYMSGAFDQGPTDIYTPGYNMGYLKMKEERGNYKYRAPATGQEKADE